VKVRRAEGFCWLRHETTLSAGGLLAAGARWLLCVAQARHCVCLGVYEVGMPGSGDQLGPWQLGQWYRVLAHVAARPRAIWSHTKLCRRLYRVQDLEGVPLIHLRDS
jgi:hypothetical protein